MESSFWSKRNSTVGCNLSAQVPDALSGLLSMEQEDIILKAQIKANAYQEIFSAHLDAPKLPFALFPLLLFAVLLLCEH